MNPCTTRPAGPGDAARLSAFAARTFADTYGADNTPEDMAAYLAGAFSPELQAAEVADPAGVTLLAEAGDGGELVGYAQLGDGPAPDGVAGAAPVELKRFYVDRPWHGRGVAGALMAAALGAARARGADAVWLGVWQRNPRAVRFYEKCGFRRVAEVTFVLGRDVQRDWIMATGVA